MLRNIAFLALISMSAFSSCTNKESAEAPKPSEQTPAVAQPASGPHAFVHLQDGSKIPGAIVASSQTDMVVVGDDGIERRIPLAQIKSVEYGESQPARQARQSAPPKRPAKEGPAPPPPQTGPQSAQ